VNEGAGAGGLLMGGEAGHVAGVTRDVRSHLDTQCMLRIEYLYEHTTEQPTEELF
jgi:hypothetical protein